eukprot:134764-Prymnesium_polylepis.1
MDGPHGPWPRAWPVGGRGARITLFGCDMQPFQLDSLTSQASQIIRCAKGSFRRAVPIVSVGCSTALSAYSNAWFVPGAYTSGARWSATTSPRSHSL